MSRSKVYPAGSRNVPVTRRMNDPSCRRRSPRKRKLPFSAGGIEADVEQVRVPVARAGDGCADELPEERVGTVGAALELRVRLGPDPERMARQLDELDEALVG